MSVILMNNIVLKGDVCGCTAIAGPVGGDACAITP